jgi:hypothetical protein
MVRRIQDLIGQNIATKMGENRLLSSMILAIFALRFDFDHIPHIHLSGVGSAAQRRSNTLAINSTIDRQNKLRFMKASKV